MVDGDRLIDHWPAIFGFINRRLLRHDPAVAEDIAAETFARAVESYDDQAGAGNLSAWLHAVAGNLVIDWSRKKARQEVPLDEVPVRTVPFQPGSAAHVELLAVNAALPLLHAYERRAFARVVQGYSLTEISDEMGASTQALKSTIFRARAKVRNAVTGMTWDGA